MDNTGTVVIVHGPQIRVVMFRILLLLLTGIGIGYALRRVPIVHKTEIGVQITIATLLFVFGCSIGSNRELIGSLGQHGGQALLIAGLATVGSLLAGWAAQRFIFRKGGQS